MALTDPRIRITATDQTRSAFRSAQRNVEGLSSSLLGFRGTLTTVLGAAGLGAVIKSVADTGDQMQKLSISLGASTEALSQYRLIAETSGTSIEALSLIWQRQTRRISEAAAGYGEARNALRELGLDAKQLNTLAPDRQFEAIAQAMEGVTSQSDKLRLAFKLFDSEGARPALQAMAGGADAMREMRAEADALGLTMTRLEADQLAGFNDELTKAQLGLRAAAERLVVALGPALQQAAQWFSAATEAATRFFIRLGAGSEIQQAQQRLEDLADRAFRINELLDEGVAGTGFLFGFQRENLLAELKQINDEVANTEARLVSLKSQAPGAEGPPAFDFTGGSLPSVEDEKAEQRAIDLAAREAERERERQQEKLTRILEFGLEEDELLRERHEERLLFLEEAYQEELISFDALQAEKLRLEGHYQGQMTQLEAKSEAERLKKQQEAKKKSLAYAATYAQSLIGVTATMSKTLFEINKVAAIAEALLSFRETVVDAYAWGTKIGGPPLGAAMAAIATAAQLANIAAIASTSFGDTAGGGSGSSAAAAVPTYDVDPVFGIPESRSRPVSQDVTIVLGDNDGLLPASYLRNLIEQLNEQIDDGAVIGSIVVA